MSGIGSLAADRAAWGGWPMEGSTSGAAIRRAAGRHAQSRHPSHHSALGPCASWQGVKLGFLTTTN